MMQILVFILVFASCNSEPKQNNYWAKNPAIAVIQSEQNSFVLFRCEKFDEFKNLQASMQSKFYKKETSILPWKPNRTNNESYNFYKHFCKPLFRLDDFNIHFIDNKNKSPFIQKLEDVIANDCQHLDYKDENSIFCKESELFLSEIKMKKQSFAKIYHSSKIIKAIDIAFKNYLLDQTNSEINDKK